MTDSSLLVARFDPRPQHHQWARSAAAPLALPWLTCEAVVVETLFLLAPPAVPHVCRVVRDGRLRVAYGLRDDVQPVLALMEKYADVPISLADACLVRMTETLPDPVMVTTDADFKIYRRHSRLVVPWLVP